MLIVPPAAVLASAALKVRHGAGRVQPWASLPPAETKLRMINPSGACARAGPAPAASTSRVAATNGNSVNFDMNALPTPWQRTAQLRGRLSPPPALGERRHRSLARSRQHSYARV